MKATPKGLERAWLGSSAEISAPGKGGGQE